MSQTALRTLMVATLVGAGVWLLHGFLPALAWAVVVAIATWPMYDRLESRLGRRGHWAPSAFLGVILVLIALPLIFGLPQLAREVKEVAHAAQDASRQGLAAPGWLASLPQAGGWLAERWNEHLGTPEAAAETFRLVSQGAGLEWLKRGGIQALHLLATAAFMLLALFFVYRDGRDLGARLLVLGHRLLGESAESYLRHAFAAIRATVNGLVLVGLGEGFLLGVAYAVCGLPHAVLLGTLTGVLAMIPFAAPLIFGGAALALVAQGSAVAGVGLAVFGSAVLFVADHFVRPALIGSAARLPFLWVLLGILGGIETFGLLGLFLGPTLMAVLVQLWRDWTER